MTKKKKIKLKSPILNETQPHQINAPSFKGTGIEIEEPFINEHGVVIGDSLYNSPNSPLNKWSAETDPEVMAGEQWVHPTNDIGWNTRENQELLESNIEPQGVPFMHPTKDTSKNTD